MTEIELTSGPGPLRKKDAERTRADILHAAALVFAQRGYAQAGMREIARCAGITPALILRYFDSKENLFTLALDAALNMDELLAGERDTFGTDIVDYFNNQVRDPNRPNPLSMQLLAISDPVAQAIATRRINDKVLSILAAWLDRDHAQERATLITAVLCGVWLFRNLLPLDTLQAPLEPGMASWLAGTLQRLVSDDWPLA